MRITWDVKYQINLKQLMDTCAIAQFAETTTAKRNSMNSMDNTN